MTTRAVGTIIGLFVLTAWASPVVAQNLLGGSSSGGVSITVTESEEDRLAREFREKEADFSEQLDRLEPLYSNRQTTLDSQQQQTSATLESILDELDQLNTVAAPRRAQLLTSLTSTLQEELAVMSQIESYLSENVRKLADLLLEARFGRSNLGLYEPGEHSMEDLAEMLTTMRANIAKTVQESEELERSRWSAMLASRANRDIYMQARADLTESEHSLSMRRTRAHAAETAGASIGRIVRDRAPQIAGRISAETRLQIAAAFRRNLNDSGILVGAILLITRIDTSPILPPIVRFMAGLWQTAAPFRAAPNLALSVQVAVLRVHRSQLDAHEQVAGADPEGDLEALGYRLQRRRFGSLDLQRELNTLTILSTTYDLDGVALRLPYQQYSERRVARLLAEREAQERRDIYKRERGLFDARFTALLIDRMRSLFTEPNLALSHATADIADSSNKVGRIMLVLLTVIVAVILLLPFVRSAKHTGSNAEDKQRKRRRWARVWRWLPITAGLIVAAQVNLVAARFESMAWFLALAPLAVNAAWTLAGYIGDSARAGDIPTATGRYLRVTLRVTVSVCALLWLTIALLFGFEFPTKAILPIFGALVVVACIGLVALMLPRESVLLLLGLRRTDGEVGVVRRIVRLFYPLFGLLSLLAVISLVLGYHNMAAIVFRRGLVIILVLLVLPGVHGAMHSWFRRTVGFPDGGGVIGTTTETATRVYRWLAPLLSSVIALTAIGVISFGMGSEPGSGGVLGALTTPFITLGESGISVLSIVVLILTIVATGVATRWLVGSLNKSVYPLYNLTTGMRATIDTLVTYATLAIGFLVGLKVIDVNLSVLAIFAGIIGIGIGFGSQTLVSNFMAGLILQFSKPISVGDIVEVEGVVGRVQRIGGASTIVRTFSNLSVIMPNAAFVSNSVINWTEDGNVRRLDVEVGVAYGSDTEAVAELLIEVAREHDLILTSPGPTVKFDNFGDSALIFTLQAWIGEARLARRISSELRHRVDAALRDANISIPFPQRDVHLQNTDAIKELARAKGWDVVEDSGDDTPEPDDALPSGD